MSRSVLERTTESKIATSQRDCDERLSFREQKMAHYDMLVIGSGPAGQKAAIQAAKVGKRVGIVERKKVAGGICINTGTIPSKSLREAVLFLSGFRQRNLYGASYRVKKDITFEDLAMRCDHVVKAEQEVIQNQLLRNHVDFIVGTATFLDPHRLSIKQDSETNEHTADFIVVAVGTETARPPEIAFDSESIIDSDGLLTLKQLPTSLTIVGGGVIGCEYASILATLGIPVVLVERRPRLLEFVDSELIEALQYQMRSIGVTFASTRKSSALRKIAGQLCSDPSQKRQEDQRAPADVLHRTGRRHRGVEPGARRSAARRTRPIASQRKFSDLRPAHLRRRRRRRLPCPRLDVHAARTARFLPRLRSRLRDVIPSFALWHLYDPGISMVGRNEDELTRDGIPYEIGVARYREIARGQIIGDTVGTALFAQRDAASRRPCDRRRRNGIGAYWPGGYGPRRGKRLLCR